MDILSLYNDRTKYPDDMSIEVQGEKLTMKEWRDSLGPKAEFTKQTQKLAEERKQLEQAVQQREAALQQVQGQLAQMIQARGGNPNVADQDDLSALRGDPYFGPLVKTIEQQKGIIQQLAQRQQMDAIAVNSWRYQQQLERLKGQDKELNPDELVKFTTDFYQKGPDLEAAHRLYTYDKTLKQREAEAEQRGYERAKAEPPLPPMPGGRRSAGGKAPVELPKSLDDRVQMAARDPEILAAWNGQG